VTAVAPRPCRTLTAPPAPSPACRQFQSCPSGASILFPIGALRALRRLTALSNGRALVISGDKGNNNPEQFKGLMDPHIAVHGSFSVMVSHRQSPGPLQPLSRRSDAGLVQMQSARVW
jgi:hypothetical protein